MEQLETQSCAVCISLLEVEMLRTSSTMWKLETASVVSHYIKPQMSHLPET